MAIGSDGTLWAWGDNIEGKLGVSAAERQRLRPVRVMTGVVGVSSGEDHTLILKNDGSVWAMGDNHSGQLGNGTYTPSARPVKVMEGAKAVSAGNGIRWLLKQTAHYMAGVPTEIISCQRQVRIRLCRCVCAAM